MNWGSIFQAAYQAATETAKQTATSMMSSAATAQAAVSHAAMVVKDAGVTAIKATGDAIVTGAVATKDAAVVAWDTAKSAAIATGEGLESAADYAITTARRPVVLVGQTGYGIASALYGQAKKLLPATPPVAAAVKPCPDTEAGKRQRLEERNRLIAAGTAPGSSAEKQAAAARLQRNNEAVELARLSGDTYQQYGSPPVNDPPPGWKAIPESQLPKGMNQLLKNSKATLYQTPADWPGGQKTVLAFRGTADGDDAIANHDQAMGLIGAQYEAAAQLGSRVEETYGSSVLVTGHSLGGGKAQAAGVTGGLKGMMFNSAGLHPETVNGLEAKADQFQQYRTLDDPLTGIQNSLVSQVGVGGLVGPLSALCGGLMKGYDTAGKLLGLDGLSDEYADYAEKAVKLYPRSVVNAWTQGYVTPPAIGDVHEVSAIGPGGEAISPLDALGQHTIGSVVNGIEEQKTEDVATLEGA